MSLSPVKIPRRLDLSPKVNNVDIEQVEQLEKFCFMMVEEFLIRKKMTKSLEAFREEWNGKEDDTNILTWYEVALKLHLVDIMKASQRQSPSVLESLAETLIKDSSIRMRQHPEVFTKGLASFPRMKPMRDISIEMPIEADIAESPSNKKYAAKKLLNSISESNISEHVIPVSSSFGAAIAAAVGSGLVSGELRTSSEAITPLKRASSKKSGTLTLSSSLEFQSNNSIGKSSSENWIPEKLRLRSLHRHITVAKETLEDIIMRETGQEREMRRFKRSDLEKAHDEERLGSKKLMKCASCFLLYSYVNLPLKVSNKALVDMRKKWGKDKPDGWWFSLDEKLSAVPRCYEESWVCLWCSQHFQDCEAYRPSFEKQAYHQKKTAFLENKKREKEYWDPLLMCEKDRELAKKQGTLFFASCRLSYYAMLLCIVLSTATRQ